MEGRILAASHDGAYVIRLTGDVRLTLCTTIDEYFQRMFDDPEFASVWVDLCDVEGIDSTTLGLLAKLAQGVSQRFGFAPAIYSCDPGINRLLHSMAFDRLFVLHEEAAPIPKTLPRFPPSPARKEAVREKVIEAHKILMGISDDNHERFKDLLSALEAG